MLIWNRKIYVDGFSLIELLVTLVILAVLASIVLPLSQMAVQRSKEQELLTSLRTIREALDAYKQASDEGRISKSADASGYPKSLQELVDGVVDARDIQKKKLYFLRKIPLDPMTESRRGEVSWGLRSYRSTADKPEAGDDVYDIYSLSDAVGLNGTPYSEW